MKKYILLIVMLFMIGCNEEPRKSIERDNIRKRFKQENVSISIKHFYVISTLGQVIIYSTVKGKVTSSTEGIILPNEIIVGSGFQVEFLYWWDSKDQYHKHYILGDQIIHISDSPLPVKNILINMENE